VDLLQYKNSMDEQGVYLSYVGPIYQGFVEETVEFLKDKVGILINSKARTQKFFIVLIELVQNIMRYSSEEYFDGNVKQKVRSGVLVIGYKEDSFFLQSGNMIFNTQVKDLEERLEILLSSDSKTLTSMYKERLTSPEGNASESAGLGLIEVARKASQPFEYKIEKISDNKSFFSITVII
jgi:hypothetical protein